MAAIESVMPLRYTQDKASRIQLNNTDIDKLQEIFEDMVRNIRQRILKTGTEMKEAVAYLARWLTKHDGKVCEAYLTRHEEHLLFLVIRNRVPVDFDLTGDLSDLEFGLHEKFKTIEFRTLALPLCSEEAIASFVSEEFAFIFSRQQSAS